MNKKFDALTIDRWMMRTWGRIIGKLITKDANGEISLINDPQNGGNRRYIRESMKLALGKLQKDYPNMTMADLQAVFWYEEKLLYAMHNVNSEEPTDYANEAAKYLAEHGVDQAEIDAVRVVGKPAGPDASDQAGGAGEGSEGVQFSKGAVDEQKAKARALGYDTSKTWYRYDTENYDEIHGNEDGIHLGAIHFAANPKNAEKRFEDIREESNPNAMGFTGQYWLKIRKTLQLRDMGTWNPESVVLQLRRQYPSEPFTQSAAFGRAEKLADKWGLNYVTELAAQEEGVDENPATEERIAANKAIIAALKKFGYDSIKYRNTFEGGTGIMVFDPGQVRSVNAKFEEGETGNVLHSKGAIVSGKVQNHGEVNGRKEKSRTIIVGDSERAWTPEQLNFFKNVGRQVEIPSVKERLAELWKDAGKKITQGVVDQFDPIKRLDQVAYGLARLSKGTAGAFEALLHHGKVKLTDNIYDADTTGGFVESVGVPLHGELEDMLWWVAAHRAEQLTAEDREHLFTQQDIDAGKTLSDGVTDWDYTLSNGQTTRDRTLIYADSMKKYDAFNRNVMDMAEQSGLIDPTTRGMWEKMMYVPFYRVSGEDQEFIGQKMGKALVRQRAFKQLKGGSEKLNADLLHNVLQNWHHLLDAGAKNRAAMASLQAADAVGVAVEADEETARQMGKSVGKRNSVVWYMDQGKQRFYLVNDPMLLQAITSLEYAGMAGQMMDGLSFFKHALTVGVTASPFFKVRNLIRDSLQAIGTADLSYNVPGNIKEGWKATKRDSQEYVTLLASGGLIRFGTMLEGKESNRVRGLIKSGVKDSTILNSDHKLQAFYDKVLSPAIAAYNEIGNRGEEINRAALYKQLTAKGMGHAEASLMARDLMDFSMQGSWATIRFLTQVVPFMNARMQGLYKLGRATAEDKTRMAIVVGAAALASLALMGLAGDDEDWKKRTDADRNNWWWFKFGGVAFRIPKPFEVGAVATLAERGWELAFDKEMTGKRFGKNVGQLLLDNLSMNPVPQAIKPIIDLYANKDSFTGTTIESMGMEKLAPEYRYRADTSMVSRAASTAMFGALSPVQVEHMVRGYFSWLGAFVIGGVDMAVRPMTDEPGRPTADGWKFATGGMVRSLPEPQSRYVNQLYEQAKVLEQAYGTYRDLIKRGKTEDAKTFAEDNREELSKYKMVERAKQAESKLNERIRQIENSRLPGSEKRNLIQMVQGQKNAYAKSIAAGL